MWYITLSYIVIFKLPVSANQFLFRSVADMTNIHITKVMQAPIRGRAPLAQAQLYPNYQPTTCITIGGTYEGGVYKNPEQVCNPVQRPPGNRRPLMATTYLLRYSRGSTLKPLRPMMPAPAGMIKPQMMLPHNIARTPGPVMMRPLIRASIRPSQSLTHSDKRELDYQEYQMLPKATYPDNGNQNPHEYKSLPNAASPDTGNTDQPDYAPLPPAVNLDNRGRDTPDYSQFANPENMNADHQEYPPLPEAGHSDNENKEHQDYQLFPQPGISYDGNKEQLQFNPDDVDERDFELYPKAHGSTSTAVPIPAQYTNDNNPTHNPDGKDNGNRKSTTSTMPPFPGGLIPNGANSGEPSQVCGGKAKCNQFVWTTKKKPPKRITEDFMLWTP